MRPIWSGAINFGLVSIGVRLYNASRPAKLNFHYLDKRDMCRIAYKKVCRQTQEEVSKENIVRGFEYKKDEYVILEDEDFKDSGIEQTYSIDIEDFVNEKEIDLSYAKKPYYLEPEKKAKPVYALFRQALTASGKAGVGKFVLREREHLVLLRAHKGLIMAQLLRFHQELASPDELDIPKVSKVAQNQLELALELIEKLSAEFNPAKYRDTYQERLEKVIQAKKEHKSIEPEEKLPEKVRAPDIVSRLKKSLSLTK